MGIQYEVPVCFLLMVFVETGDGTLPPWLRDKL